MDSAERERITYSIWRRYPDDSVWEQVHHGLTPSVASSKATTLRSSKRAGKSPVVRIYTDGFNPN